MTGARGEAERFLKAGQVAKAAAVNRRALRNLERQGLLPEVVRTAYGRRLYPPETVEILRVLNSAQRLGLTRAQMADLIGAGTVVGTAQSSPQDRNPSR